MNIINEISKQLNLRVENIQSAVQLMDEGSTVPFIARYRKEVTGGLTDENLRDIEAKLVYLRNLEDRKKTIFASLADQNITDEELLQKIENSLSMAEIEDYYRPYKPKKKTRASKAKAAGLEPLSKFIIEDKTGTLEIESQKYLCDEFPTKEKCIQGALDILAEKISDNADYRLYIKAGALKNGVIQTTKNKDANDQTFDNYQEYSRPIRSLKGYNTLAINRGTEKDVLSRKFVYDDETILYYISKKEIPSGSPYKELLLSMVKDSYTRLIKPSVDNDIFSDLMDKASDEAVEEFKTSLKATLLQPPLKERRILGFDPGFSHGCKLAFIDTEGKVLDTFVLNNPFMNERSLSIAKSNVISLLKKNKTNTIALGNGTASRESEKLLKEIKAQYPEFASLEIVIVSESGASIWSATADAQKEFPNFEPNLRSAISIARRLEDPLAELVKIPPESIGVGQYQYDIDKSKLSLALDGVVEDCVNFVGVNLNTASAALLSHVSGISSKIALSIVAFREENGVISSRKALLKVPYLGPKAFQNCAGFLRIPESKEPLDNTAVHPESYPIAKAILSSLKTNDEKERIELLKAYDEMKISEMAKELNIGVPTLRDIINELIKPSRDPRDAGKVAKLNESVTDIKDLTVGMILEGTVRNVTGFGFFVDLGIEINGLVHISQLADHYVSDPHTVGKPGDIIKVKVIELDLNRKRISLSMKGIKQN
ncbi:MAG: Tex family protein [Bacilli bacterium]